MQDEMYRVQCGQCVVLLMHSVCCVVWLIKSALGSYQYSVQCVVLNLERYMCNEKCGVYISSSCEVTTREESMIKPHLSKLAQV